MKPADSRSAYALAAILQLDLTHASSRLSRALVASHTTLNCCRCCCKAANFNFGRRCRRCTRQCFSRTEASSAEWNLNPSSSSSLYQKVPSWMLEKAAASVQCALLTLASASAESASTFAASLWTSNLGRIPSPTKQPAARSSSSSSKIR